MFSLSCFAQDPATTPSHSPSSSPSPVTTPMIKDLKKSKGKKTRREKEAEGTEAADRFEADVVIKSQYKLDGKSLEVDPD
jgi:hypothetical protein